LCLFISRHLVDHGQKHGYLHNSRPWLVSMHQFCHDMNPRGWIFCASNEFLMYCLPPQPLALRVHRFHHCVRCHLCQSLLAQSFPLSKCFFLVQANTKCSASPTPLTDTGVSSGSASQTTFLLCLVDVPNLFRCLLFGLTFRLEAAAQFC
jgi:hypothetical protein